MHARPPAAEAPLPEPLPPAAATRQPAWWLLPFVLSLLFVASVAAWLQWSDQRDLDEQRRLLISDALTLESRFSARLASEQAQLEALADRLAAGGFAPASLPHQPGAIDGLRRFWLSLTWLDANRRVLAQVPEQVPRDHEAPRRDASFDDTGLSAHLSVELAAPHNGRLVARYAPSAMLHLDVPWWLTRRYDVRLEDGLGQVIAANNEGTLAPDLPSHRISLEPALADAWLVLTARDRHVPWWRTLPLALMAVFLLLVGAATWLLRRQVHEVSRAEAAWRREVAWRRAMEDSLTVGLRARDLEGRLLYVNRAFCDLIGRSAEELVGRLPPMPYWPPDTLAETLLRHRRNLAGEAPREGYEARWLHRDGRALQVMIFEAPLIDGSGRQVGWMGSVLDITERRAVEERERRQAETMTHQARLTMLGEIASTLAHELNQPLTAIASYNAGVLNSLQRLGVDDAVVLRALQRLGEQAASAGQIVQRIRAFLTRRAPQRERCALPEVARRAVALLRRDLQRHEVRVDWHLAIDLALVDCDPVLIEQVLINLVRNAIDELATRPAPRGGRRIAIALAAAGPRFVRVDVSDNGPGLGGRRIEQLCAPFYSTKAEGMGIGLAICRSILEAHHGVFDAGEAAEGGARFSFTLPVAGEEVGSEADAQALTA